MDDATVPIVVHDRVTSLIAATARQPFVGSSPRRIAARARKLRKIAARDDGTHDACKHWNAATQRLCPQRPLPGGAFCFFHADAHGGAAAATGDGGAVADPTGAPTGSAASDPGRPHIAAPAATRTMVLCPRCGAQMRASRLAAHAGVCPEAARRRALEALPCFREVPSLACFGFGGASVARQICSRAHRDILIHRLRRRRSTQASSAPTSTTRRPRRRWSAVARSRAPRSVWPSSRYWRAFESRFGARERDRDRATRRPQKSPSLSELWPPPIRASPSSIPRRGVCAEAPAVQKSPHLSSPS